MHSLGLFGFVAIGPFSFWVYEKCALNSLSFALMVIAIFMLLFYVTLTLFSNDKIEEYDESGDEILSGVCTKCWKCAIRMYFRKQEKLMSGETTAESLFVPINGCCCCKSWQPKWRVKDVTVVLFLIEAFAGATAVTAEVLFIYSL